MVDLDDPHARAALARQALLVLLGLAALLVAASLLRDLRLAATQRWGWEQHPATVTNMADPWWVELEVAEALLPRLGEVARPEMATPSQEGQVRILLPRAAYVGYDVFDTVHIAQDPAQPEALQVQDLVAQALPPLVKLLWLAALGAAAWPLLRARWAEDLSWIAGSWTATAQTAQRAGTQGHLPALTEIRSSHQAVVFWTLLTGAGALATAGWAFIDDEGRLLEAGSIALVLLGLFGLALRTAIGVFTRRVWQDATGLCDRDFFRTRRVAWKEIAGMQRVNLNEGAQQRYDRQSKRSGMRPQNLMVWTLRDAQGTEILQLPDTMEPAETFAALRRRIMGPLAAARPEEEDEDDTAPGLHARAEEPGEAPRPVFAPAHRGLVVCLAVLLLPLLLGTGYSSWRSLWFLYGAAAAPGTVVERSDEGAPSVVVAFADAEGRDRRTTSGGSDFYADIAVGDRITVYYDPADPDSARLDLFLELWIVPLLLGSFSLVLLLAGAVVVSSLRRPFSTR